MVTEHEVTGRKRRLRLAQGKDSARRSGAMSVPPRRVATVAPPKRLTAAGLFAGIGGLEKGLSAAGVEAELLCEWWAPAKQVLRARWPGVDLHGDVRELRALPRVD